MATAYPVAIRVAGGDAGVDFQLLVKGYLQQFRISYEALEDHFGLQGSAADAQLKAFNDNWQRICEVASRADGVPSNGALLIESIHF